MSLLQQCRSLLARLPLPSGLRRRPTPLPTTPNPNSYWVVPDRFLAGEYPSGNTAGEARHKIKAFLDAGITSFIDLTPPTEMFPYASLLKGAGVDYQRFPIPDNTAPDDPRRMAEILDAVDLALAARRKVYLHCQAGVGRTGMVVACWLQRHGRTSREALRELRDLWRTTERSQRMRRSPNRAVQVAWVKNWAQQAARVEASPGKAPGSPP